MRKRCALVLVAPLAILTGCPATHQSPPARAQEAATELNTNTRFGRMELAAEHVAPTSREPFFDRRRAWGGQVRVADYEMLGLRMKGESDAEVFVKIAWYRIDENSLHVTTIKQKWHDFKGSFRLVDETREAGDMGLLGEHVATAPRAPKQNAQFPTIRLGGEKPPASPPTEEPAKEPEETKD